MSDCRHCNNKTDLSNILCNTCAQKALDILPSDIKERIAIYKVILDSTENPITIFAVKQLLEWDKKKLEDEVLHIPDWFSTRE